MECDPPRVDYHCTYALSSPPARGLTRPHDKVYCAGAKPCATLLMCPPLGCAGLLKKPQKMDAERVLRPAPPHKNLSHVRLYSLRKRWRVCVNSATRRIFSPVRSRQRKEQAG